MATVRQFPANGTDTQEIVLTYVYNPAKEGAAAGEYTVTVTPSKVHKNTTVFFTTDKGGKVRIAFLSPEGDETDQISDSQPYTITKGGVYRFNCYFTPNGSTDEISVPSGGVLDVIPHH